MASPPSKTNALRIFVKGVNWVGDAVMTTAALRHLRQSFPRAHITLMVRPWVAAVHEYSDDINELWVEDESASISAFWRAVRRVRASGFSLGVALPNSIRSAMLLKLGGIPQRIGYRRGMRGLLLNRSVPLLPEYLKEHQVYYYLHILEPSCGRLATSPHLRLKPGEVEREETRRLLAELGLDRNQSLIGIAPGSINSVAKRWPAERFAELAVRLASTWDAEVLLIGSDKEADVLGRVASLCRGPVHNLTGRLTLGGLIALMEKLQGFVANDSGAMHLAAAMNVPQVAIFGPTEWVTTSPFSQVASIVRKPVDCSPCMLRDCPIDHRCMTGVSVDEVLAAFEKMIGARLLADSAPQTPDG